MRKNIKLLYAYNTCLHVITFFKGFSIEGPSQAKIECDDKGDGSCDVRYWPTEPEIMRFMSSVMMKISKTAPSWPIYFQQLMMSSLRR